MFHDSFVLKTTTETAIGLFPDVGGSFFLPRLDGELGMFLALTGQRLKGKDLLWVSLPFSLLLLISLYRRLLHVVMPNRFAGVATHFVQSSKLEFIENQLTKSSGMDTIGIADLLEDFSDESEAPFSLSKHREVIDRCFSKSSVEEIVEALKAEVWIHSL